MNASVMTAVAMRNKVSTTPILIGIAAHSQEVREHDDRIRDDKPSDELARSVAIVKTLHHDDGGRIKQHGINDKTQCSKLE